MTRTVYISKEQRLFVARDASTNEVLLPPSDRRSDIKDLAECYQYELVSKPATA